MTKYLPLKEGGKKNYSVKATPTTPAPPPPEPMRPRGSINVPLTEVESAITAQILKDKQGTHEACGEIGKAGQIGRIIDKIHNAMRGSLAGRS